MSDDYLPALLAALQADATLVAALTGGIYVKRDTRGKFTPKLYPTAYDTNGFLKPVLIIKGRTAAPFGGKDNSNQFQQTRQPVEFWFHQDGSAGYDELYTASRRVYALLAYKPYAGAAQFRWNGSLEYDDPELNFAATLRIEYLVIGSRSA